MMNSRFFTSTTRRSIIAGSALCAISLSITNYPAWAQNAAVQSRVLGGGSSAITPSAPPISPSIGAALLPEDSSQENETSQENENFDHARASTIQPEASLPPAISEADIQKLKEAISTRLRKDSEKIKEAEAEASQAKEEATQPQNPIDAATTQIPSAPKDPIETMPAAAGIAPPLSQSDIDAELQSKTGPALPDATLGQHYMDGLAEAALKRQKSLLQKQNDVLTELITVLQNQQSVRIALAKQKLPIIVNPPTDPDAAKSAGAGNTGPQRPTGPAGWSPTSQPIVQRPNSDLMNNGSPQNTKQSASKSDKNDDTPPAAPSKPVIYNISESITQPGVLTATLLIPNLGIQEFNSKSSRNKVLPGGYQITQITPTGVNVRNPDGDIVPLKFARSTQ